MLPCRCFAVMNVTVGRNTNDSKFNRKKKCKNRNLISNLSTGWTRLHSASHWIMDRLISTHVSLLILTHINGFFNKMAFTFHSQDF